VPLEELEWAMRKIPRYSVCLSRVKVPKIDFAKTLTKFEKIPLKDYLSFTKLLEFWKKLKIITGLGLYCSKNAP